MVEIADVKVTASYCNLPSVWEQTGKYPVECPTTTTTTTTTATTATRKVLNGRPNNGNGNGTGNNGYGNDDAVDSNPANPPNPGGVGDTGGGGDGTTTTADNDGNAGNGNSGPPEPGKPAEPDDTDVNAAAGLSLPVVIAIGAGGFVVVLVMVVLACCRCKRSSKRNGGSREGGGGGEDGGIAMARLGRVRVATSPCVQPISICSRFGSKLSLSIYADVRADVHACVRADVRADVRLQLQYDVSHQGKRGARDTDSMYQDPTTYADPSELHSLIREWAVEIKLDEIDLKGSIGKGEFGNVHKAVWNGSGTNVEPVCACKTMRASTKSSNGAVLAFLKEAAVMGQFDHPCVIQLLGVVLEEGPKSPMIVIELMANGGLGTYLAANDGQFDVPALLGMSINVCDGMYGQHRWF